MKYKCERCGVEIKFMENIFHTMCPYCLPASAQIKLLPIPNTGKTLTIELECGDTTCDACKLMGHSLNGFMTCKIYNLHLKPIVSTNDKNNIENYVRLSACRGDCQNEGRKILGMTEKQIELDDSRWESDKYTLSKLESQRPSKEGE